MIFLQVFFWFFIIVNIYGSIFEHMDMECFVLRFT